MVRIRREGLRNGWFVAALVVGLAATGCKKSDDGAKTTDKGGGGGEGGEDLGLLPVDSQVVIGLNFGQLQQSPLWKQFVAPKLGSMPGLDKFKTICGFDPFESLKSVTIGAKGMEGDNVNAVVVLHGYDKSKSMTCFDNDGIAEAQKDGTKVSVEGDVVLLAKDNQTVGFTFVNDSTAIGVVGPDGATKDSVKKVAAGGGTLKSSHSFTDIMSKVKSSDTVWAVVNGDAPMFKQAAQMGIKPKAVFGSLNVTDGITADLHLRMNTPDEATQVVTLAKSQSSSPQVKNFVDKLDIGSEGADANISIAIGSQKLQAILAFAGAFAGGGGHANMAAPVEVPPVK